MLAQNGSNAPAQVKLTLCSLAGGGAYDIGRASEAAYHSGSLA